MPKSFRIDPVLERRLAEVAARENVPVSTVIREAIVQYCDTALSTDARTRLADVTGIVDTQDASAGKTGQAFTGLLLAKARRRAAADDSD